jgi:hypothetical protein
MSTQPSRGALRWLPPLAALLVALGLAGPPAAAQETETPADPAVEEAGETTGAADEEAAAPYGQIEEILEGEEEVLSGGGYSYDPGGRRDPFVSLLQRTRVEEEGGVRPEGVPGLLIDEIDLKGIFELNGRYFAQVQTADKERSYLIQEGDTLYDGEVVAINREEVVFKQIVNDPSIIKPFREVVKKLNPEP